MSMEAKAKTFLTPWEAISMALDGLTSAQYAQSAWNRYSSAFTLPFLLAVSYFYAVERERMWKRTPAENVLAYLKLATMNMNIGGRLAASSLKALSQGIEKDFKANLGILQAGDIAAGRLAMKRQSDLMRRVASEYPKAIDGVKEEFGFHFERQPPDSRIDETDRFILYQVMPTDPQVRIRQDAKPVLIIPPFVLGANILSFLPGEQRSYAHAFANQGIPTYVRLLKEIADTVAVQVMRPEDDALDNRRFCRLLASRHGVPVTLNGYCQGGFSALCDLLSGELDDVVDAFITCVSPIDGTRSKGLAQFLRELPMEFNDLAYGTKVLPNGNRVADGTLMGWVYKLRSIEKESPLQVMWRDILLLDAIKPNGELSISKTAAALNYWLTHERSDLPLEITRMSFASYNTAIAADGTLPVRMFGRSLNIKRIAERKIPWLICYGMSDELVEPDTALAPSDFIEVETAGFPKGHVAIATSWSHPESQYALQTRFDDGKTRGPVRYHLDLQDQLDAGRRAASQPKAEAAAPASRQPTPGEA
jgi:hypothetical protein